MSKINNQNHLKNLAQRKDHDKNKTLGHRRANKDKDNDKNAKEKKEEEDENAKCKWYNILSILCYVTIAVFVNYAIGAAVIYYLSHPSVVENLNKDYPVDLDASPFCLYSPENLDADNKVLEENNKILAGDCTITALFYKIIDGIKAIFTSVESKAEDAGEYIEEKAPNPEDIVDLAVTMSSLVGKEAEKEASSTRKRSKTVGGAAVRPRSKTLPTKLAPEPATHKSSSKPKPEHRTLKQIKDRRKNQECEEFKWGDGNYMFGEKQGDQSERGDLHLFNGPVWIAPRSTLSFVALAKYQTIMNDWLKLFINPFCSIISPDKTNSYFYKALLGTFSSVIMVFFIVYFFIAHFFTLCQLSLAIFGKELGRYVADSDTGSTLYCVKETFSWIFAKLIPLIYVPIITNLFLLVPLSNSVYKFFISSLVSAPWNCCRILSEIIEVILFVWLGVLIYIYFKEFSSCPDNDIISIFNMKVAPLKMFPIGFAVAASSVFLYSLYS